MSFSRFSVLAVFLMMAMSAFVAVPTYNVGADEGDYVCYDMDTHEVDWDTKQKKNVQMQD